MSASDAPSVTTQGAHPRPVGTAATPAKASLIHQPSSYFEPLNLARVFPRPAPLEVELGSGDGSFLVQYAQANPERNFLGVERLLGRLRKIERKAQRAGVANLRVLRIEAGYFLEYLLPAKSTEALHIYFPDPWPKRKHRKNRLVNSRFPELASRVLREGGTVYLRTDDPDYFAQMLAVFGASPSFHRTETPRSLASILTDFERDFHSRGIQTLNAAYQALNAP